MPKEWALHIRHSQLNDLIWRAVKKAQIPASKEPIGLSSADGQLTEFIEDLERRITTITKEPPETTYLYKRMSVTLQRGNAVAFRNTVSES